MGNTMAALTLAAALGSGLIAGVFFAFSTFVMGALAKLPAPQGIAAMQQINIVVINPWFMAAFMGTAVACVVLGVMTVLQWATPGSAWRVVGCALYVVGTFGVTIAFNVPRNNALAAVDPGSAAGAELWATYLREWTMWNHVRAVAAAAAMLALVIGLWVSRGGGAGAAA